MRTKTFLSIIFIIIIYSKTEAQLISSYGIKFGIVEASQSWNYSSTLSYLKIFNKPRLGIDIGAYVEWFNFPIISAITEIHYIQKGCKDEFEVSTVTQPDGNGVMKTITPRIDYISMPVLLKIRFETKLFTFYGIGGPRFDFLIGRNSDASGAVFDELKSTDFGVTIGVGFDIPLGIIYRIGGEFRYSPSNSNIFSNQVLTVKNKSLEFLLTVGF